MAFSRNPNLLLLSQRGDCFPPPMNRVSQLHTGKQPVAYENVVLVRGALQGDDKRQQEALLPLIHVDWGQGRALIFESIEDAFQNLVQEEILSFHAPCRPRSSKEYVEETLRFLERGHSLLHPECACRHGLPAERCLELGITPHHARKGGCTLSTSPQEVTEADLARELAVEDLKTLFLPTPKSDSLMGLLLGHCNHRITEEGVHLFSSPKFFVGPIR